MFFQSNFMVAVRSRTSPEFTPLETSGNPPPTSKFTLPLVLAPITWGPNTSKPKIDWRSVPPNEPDESRPPAVIGQRGNIHVVDRTLVAEQVEQHDARKSHAILRRALHLGLVLLVDLAGEHLLLVLEVAHARVDLAQGWTSRLAGEAARAPPPTPAAGVSSRRGWRWSPA